MLSKALPVQTDWSNDNARPSFGLYAASDTHGLRPEIHLVPSPPLRHGTHPQLTEGEPRVAEDEKDHGLLSASWTLPPFLSQWGGHPKFYQHPFSRAKSPQSNSHFISLAAPPRNKHMCDTDWDTAKRRSVLLCSAGSTHAGSLCASL